VQPIEGAEEGDGRMLLAGKDSHTPHARPFCNPVTLLLLAYLFLNFGSIGSMETYPLYLTRNDSSGLGLRPIELGEVTVMGLECSPSLAPVRTVEPSADMRHSFAPASSKKVMLPQSGVVLLMPLVYPWLSRRCGHKACLYVGCATNVRARPCLHASVLFFGHP
jgi:hypothetical protein